MIIIIIIMRSATCDKVFIAITRGINFTKQFNSDIDSHIHYIRILRAFFPKLSHGVLF